MATDKKLEKIYELLEQYDFCDLSEQDKNFVISAISEADYINMRKTIKDTENFFTITREPNLDESVRASLMNGNKKENRIIKFLNHPVQLYKVAASILIILALTTLFNHIKTHKVEGLQAYHDTVVVKNTDTLVVRLIDTVKIITNKIVYVNQSRNNDIQKQFLANNAVQPDCKIELCPNDIEAISNLTRKSNIVHDTLLSDFIMAIK